MGDVAMSVPVIRALADQYPDSQITIVSKPFLKPLFDEIPNLSFHAAEVQGKHKGFLGLYRLFKELKKQNITCVADVHNVLRSKILRFFFRFTSAKIAFIDKGRADKKALTREENKVFKQLKTSVQRYADVLKKLGFSVSLDSPKPIPKKPLSTALSAIIGGRTKPRIGVAPFAAFQGKMYPLPLMKEVISQLSQTSQILLFGGGQKEIDLLNEIESSFENTINIAGKISFH